jgi:hypothetical protein
LVILKTVKLLDVGRRPSSLTGDIDSDSVKLIGVSEVNSVIIFVLYHGQCPACSIQHEIYTCHTPRKVYETDAGYANLEGAYVLLDMPILKAHTSYRLSLFLPTDERKAVRATAASAIASAEASTEKKKALVFNTALVLIVLQDGVAKSESQCQIDSTTGTCTLLTNGWAWYRASIYRGACKILHLVEQPLAIVADIRLIAHP